MNYKNNKIFVQIAAYRDPELLPTIRDCIEKARWPENLSFGICHQDETFFNDYDEDPRFKILKINYKDAKGACWARSKVNELYSGEKYTLQIDSHMRFIQNWDEELISMRDSLEDTSAVLTTYPAEYLPTQTPDQWKKEPHTIHVYSIKNGHTEQRPKVPPDWRNRKIPYKAIHVAAGFIFGLGRIIEDVPYDPEFYFQGEETALAIRLYTHGYNLYHPHKIILWHYYGRSGQPKHWDDDKSWGNRSILATERLDCMLGRNKKYNLGKYGLGKVRTLQDFQRYSGIDYERKILHIDTVESKEPPVDLSDKLRWSYEIKKFKKTMQWDYSTVDKCDDPKFWAFIFKDKNDSELHRVDITYKEAKDIIDGKITEKEFEFQYYHPAQVPTTFMIWPYSESKKWLKNRITTIPDEKI